MAIEWTTTFLKGAQKRMMINFPFFYKKKGKNKTKKTKSPRINHPDITRLERGRMDAAIKRRFIPYLQISLSTFNVLEMACL